MDEQQRQTPESNWQFKSGASEQPVLDGENISQDNQAQAPNIEAIQWSASEYIDHQKDAKWYSLLFLGSIIITLLVFLTTRDLLPTLAISVAVLSVGFFASRSPQTKQYSLDEKGIKVDDKQFSFSQFRSFSIVEEGAINSIWLKPLKRIAPPVVVYFSPEDENKIAEALSVFLPHEDRELDSIDRFSKRIRF